jgi:hypothetical protein
VGEIVQDVQARNPTDTGFNAAQEGLKLNVGGQIKTGAVSQARLDLSDGTIVRIAADSSFLLQELSPAGANWVTRVQLELGKVWVSLSGGTLEVETPVGVASVRGSFAGFAFDPVTGTLFIQCLEGSCSATNANGQIDLGNFQGSSLTQAGPGKVIILTGQDLQDFMRNNPEVGNAIVATLTAAPPATGTPGPYGATTGLNNSPLYQALARRQVPVPVGPVSSGLTVLGFFLVAAVYRRNRRP